VSIACIPWGMATTSDATLWSLCIVSPAALAVRVYVVQIDSLDWLWLSSILSSFKQHKCARPISGVPPAIRERSESNATNPRQQSGCCPIEKCQWCSSLSNARDRVAFWISLSRNAFWSKWRRNDRHYLSTWVLYKLMDNPTNWSMI
jgi:hypothetical protein